MRLRKIEDTFLVAFLFFMGSSGIVGKNRGKLGGTGQLEKPS